MTAYIEGDLGLGPRWVLRQHLTNCPHCFQEYERQESLISLIERVSNPLPPADLRTRIESALSIEANRDCWSRWNLHLSNIMKPLLVPAVGGLLSAMILFFSLISNVLISRRMLADDVPLTYLAGTWVSHPRMSVPTPFGVTEDTVVLAFIDLQGGVYDFRFVPEGDYRNAKLESEVANALVTTQFHPATSFGKPVMGAILISFTPVTRVTVKG
jgi:hypothetical protein